MKNSETDRELTELIKSALESYQEDYVPGAWESFVNQRKKSKKIMLWRIGAGIAACLMIGWLGINLNYPELFNFSVTPQLTNIRINKSEAPVVNEPLKSIGSINKKVFAENITEIGLTQKTLIAKVKKAVSQDSLNKSTISATAVINNEYYNDSTKKKLRATPYQTDTLHTVLVSTTDRADSTKTASDRSLSKSYPIGRQNTSQKIAENKGTNISIKRKIRIGVNFSPGMTSTQTNSSFNFSGGLNTDFALFANFQLSTGLQIEHQNVISNIGNHSSVSQVKSKADLVNLDLPLNITWKFFSDKSRSYYVSGGVSSLAYLSEKYDKTIYAQQLTELKTMAAGVQSLAYQVVNVESNEQQTEAPFHTFNIAGRLNILVGMEQHLSSKLSLHVEPYMKIPVSGLGTQNLRFTTGGVTCKISF